MSITDQIKARIDLVSFVHRHVPGLKKSGKYFKACCPFHEEKTPSFVINAEQNTWYCYGACATGGDIFTFYQTLHRVDFKVALQELAQEAGIDLPAYDQQKEVQHDLQRQYDLLTKLAGMFHQILCDTDEAWFVREYLKNRELSSETIDQWQLGYAPARNLLPELLEQGVRQEDLLELGIIYRSSSGELRSRFYNRLIFPIANPAGQVIGFAGRALGKHKAKYINSSESTIFKKSDTLYGWHHAKQCIRQQNKVVMVEGYIDVLKAHQAGFTNVVGQMGTTLTEGQISQIRANSVQSILLCLDGDSAGQNATDRAIESLIKYAQTKDIRIVRLPAGYDPDEIIQAGQWERYLGEAVPVTFHLIDRYSSRLPHDASLAQRHAVANELIPKLYQLETDTSRLWTIQQLAFHLQLNEMALIDTARRLMNVRAQIVPHRHEDAGLYPDAHAYPLEAYFLACLIEHPTGYCEIQTTFEKLQIEPLSRIDFVAFGDLFEQIIAAIETDGFVSGNIDIDPARLTTMELDYEDMVYNAVRLRFNQIEQRLRDVMQLRDLDRFNAVLYEREILRERLEEMV